MAEAVLIAALSARALAASARRAGYRPLVVDCFGDQDLAELAEDSRCLPAHMRVGLRRQPLLHALDELVAAGAPQPKGLVLGAGFEDRPNLVRALQSRFPVLGSDADTIAAAKDPDLFFKMLHSLNIDAPETTSTPPKDARGWVKKRVGASGGVHIRRCEDTSVRPSRRQRRFYYQRRVEGDAISVLGVVGKDGTAFAISKQWCTPSKSAPYRFGGAVNTVALAQDREGEVLKAALAITEALGLVGLVSVDFIVGSEGVFCLEVNPRPGATLDIHDDDLGSLFEAHMIACDGGDPAAFLKQNWRQAAAKAIAYLYADQGAVTIDRTDWPDWVRDRPAAGTTLPRGQPLASVHAEAATADAAEHLCRRHVASLEKMLYDNDLGKDINP